MQSKVDLWNVRNRPYITHAIRKNERSDVVYQKVCLGGLLILILVFILILPLLLFSSVSPALTAKPITKADVEASLLVGIAT